MARNIDHIIYSAHDPEIAVFIFAGTVAGEIHAGDLRPVLLHIAVGIAVNGTQHSWPGLLENQESAGTSRDWFAFHGNDVRHYSREWFRSGTRFGCNRAWN